MALGTSSMISWWDNREQLDIWWGSEIKWCGSGTIRSNIIVKIGRTRVEDFAFCDVGKQGRAKTGKIELREFLSGAKLGVTTLLLKGKIFSWIKTPLIWKMFFVCKLKSLEPLYPKVYPYRMICVPWGQISPFLPH